MPDFELPDFGMPDFGNLKHRQNAGPGYRPGHPPVYQLPTAARPGQIGAFAENGAPQPAAIGIRH